MPKSRAFSASVSTCSADSGSSMPQLRSVVGTLWSTTASVFSGARTLRPRDAQAFEGLRARHLVDEMAVDIEEAGAVGLARRPLVVPDLVVEGSRFHGLGSLLQEGFASGVRRRRERSATKQRAVGGEEPGEEARRQARMVADRREGHRRMRRCMPTRSRRQRSGRVGSHGRYITAARRASIATLYRA